MPGGTAGGIDIVVDEATLRPDDALGTRSGASRFFLMRIKGGGLSELGPGKGAYGADGDSADISLATVSFSE